MAFINSLPRDIAYNIFCKAWLYFLQDPDFADTYHQQSTTYNSCLIMTYDPLPPPSKDLRTLKLYIDNDHKQIKVSKSPVVNAFEVDFNMIALSAYSTCNGVVCMTDPLESTQHIFNPVTREKLELTVDDRGRCDYLQCEWIIGLGYDANTRVYKVIKIPFFCKSYRNYKRNLDDAMLSEVIRPRGCRGKILTVGTDTWRTLAELPNCLIKFGGGNTVYANGAIHWLLGKSHFIVSLDMPNEKLHVTSCPTSRTYETTQEGPKRYLSDINGMLNLIELHLASGVADLWVLNDCKLGKTCWTKSWIKRFNFNLLSFDNPNSRPPSFPDMLENMNIMLVWSTAPSKLSCYDMTAKNLPDV